MTTSWTGRRFGRLIIIDEVEPIVRSYPGRPVHRERRVRCRCDCGGVGIHSLGHLKNGRTKSCGCHRKECSRVKFTKHGATLFRIRTPEYRTWKAMKQRCENPNNQDFEIYGGRGITICERWRNDFAAFLADMGLKPSPRHSIDRYPDNDGNYEPGNCRWATPKEQRLNQRCAKQAGALNAGAAR